MPLFLPMVETGTATEALLRRKAASHFRINNQPFIGDDALGAMHTY